MSMTDPLADMFTRILNGQTAGKTEVRLPASKAKVAVCKVLQQEGYIDHYGVTENGNLKELTVALKYYKGAPVIEQLSRVSRPGRRIYRGKDELPSILGGLGVAVVSTPKGVMADHEARAQGHGGEVLCVVS